ncbi:hypothetical protein MSL71_51450 [Desulfoluna butyratoxydans]|uniref:Uncharacterized protein n=1 Tax=Desulfoluna butyratoxydans TaxID=231438 RepID=A0A4U8YSS8_9BACT|nr:hypothetical protein MSL71_51450 [Desulfoluna butyratoxydans]
MPIFAEIFFISPGEYSYTACNFSNDTLFFVYFFDFICIEKLNTVGRILFKLCKNYSFRFFR